jgi:hypothetical protein
VVDTIARCLFTLLASVFVAQGEGHVICLGYASSFHAQHATTRGGARRVCMFQRRTAVYILRGPQYDPVGGNKIERPWSRQFCFFRNL